MADVINEIVHDTTRPHVAPGDEHRQALIGQFGPRQRFTVMEDPGRFRKLALSQDGNTLAAAARNVVCLWNTRSRERINRFVFDCNVREISLSADGQSLLVVDAANAVHGVDVIFSAVRDIARLGHNVTAADLDASSSLAVVGDEYGGLTIFDPRDYASAVAIDCGGPVESARVYADAGVVVAAANGSSMVYRVSDQACLFSAGAESRPSDPGEAPAVPVLCRTDAGLTVYDAVAGRELCVLNPPGSCFDYTPDGSTIAVGGFGHVAAWDGIRGSTINRVGTYVHDVSDVKITSDGTSFYVCGDDSSVDNFAVDGARLGAYVDMYSPIMAAQVTADYRHLVVSDQRGVVAVYDLITGTVERYMQHACCISKQCLSGSLVATGAHDGLAKVLDIETGRVVFSAGYARSPVQGVALDPDGFLVTGNRLGMVQRHDMESGDVVMDYHGNNRTIRCLDISRCKRYLLSTADDGTILVFDYHTGKCLNRFSEPNIVYSGVFAECGDLVHIGNGIGEVVTLRSAVPEVVDRWPVHRTDVRSVTTWQGKLCSIGINDDAHILDLETGESLLECPVDSMPLRRIAFLNHDGTRFVTGGQDGRLTIRDPSDGSVIAEMHNLGHGYLWTTRQTDAVCGESNWFWTDQEQLIQVHTQTAGVESLLPPSADEHAEFIAVHNNQIATMSLVGLSPDARNAELEQALGSGDALYDYLGMPQLTHDPGV